MTFDGTIHLGDVLAALVFLFTIGTFHLSNVRRIKATSDKLEQRTVAMETKIGVIYDWFQDFIKINGRRS